MESKEKVSEISRRHQGLGWPCAHCTGTGTEPFSAKYEGEAVVPGSGKPCVKACDDGFIKFLGYYDDKDLPVKPGDRVRIRKGTLIKTIYHGERLAGRTYVVTVNHVLNGVSRHRNYHLEMVPTESPKIRWPGPGGYWSEADINDVELVA